MSATGGAKLHGRGRFVIRRAGPADANDIAAVHLDSIRAIGPRHYEPSVVTDWAASITADLYTTAMARGEVFFIALRSAPRPRCSAFHRTAWTMSTAQRSM